MKIILEPRQQLLNRWIDLLALNRFLEAKEEETSFAQKELGNPSSRSWRKKEVRIGGGRRTGAGGDGRVEEREEREEREVN